MLLTGELILARGQFWVLSLGHQTSEVPGLWQESLHSVLTASFVPLCQELGSTSQVCSVYGSVISEVLYTFLLGLWRLSSGCKQLTLFIL